MGQTAAAEVTIGTVLGGTYEVTGVLGQGGMGVVFLARNVRLPDMRVAIKLLRASTGIDKDAFARFRREAEVATRIGHPNIAHALDFNTLPSGTPYLVLELLEGEDLEHRLRAGPIALETALGIARQIGSALYAAHREQIIHRDLKPANIFLCPADVDGEPGLRVKVLDFGISKIRGSETVITQEAALVGTPQYMAPEQAAGWNDRVDQRSDLFALAAIVHEMLGGKPAFSGATIAEVVCKVMTEPPPPLPRTLPANVLSALERALDKSPERRHPDVASFIAELTGKPLQLVVRRLAVGSDVIAPVEALAQTGAAVAATADAFAPTVTPPPLRPPPQSTEQVAPPRRHVGVIFTTLLALVAVVAVAWGISARKAVESPRPSVAVAPPPAVETARPDPPAAPVPPPPPAPVPPSPPDDEAGAEQNRRKPAPAPASPTVRKEVRLPPEVASELDGAERALARGDSAEALRLARHTLLVKKTGRAYQIMTRAHCQAGDLGGARATMHSVSATDRAQVIRSCMTAGVDLR